MTDDHDEQQHEHPEESSSQADNSNAPAEQPASEPKVCGIVMPISEIDGCSESHWREVLAIHKEAIRAAGFKPVLVSDADDSGVIHKRIVQNLFTCEIVVCDVSGRNANVMFELGMRLTFDKATVIVKDDPTPYSFDTGIIEHLPYPRDLRFAKIVDFKERLTKKIRSTRKLAAADPKYSAFLQHFGEFSVPKLETKEVDKEDFVLSEMIGMKKELQGLRQQMVQLTRSSRGSSFSSPATGSGGWKLLGQYRSKDESQAEANTLNAVLTQLIAFLTRRHISPSEMTESLIDEFVGLALAREDCDIDFGTMHMLTRRAINILMDA